MFLNVSSSLSSSLNLNFASFKYQLVKKATSELYVW